MSHRSSRPFLSCRGVALWVYIVVLVGIALATVFVLLLYRNIIERKAEATQHVFRVVNVDDKTTDPALWGKNYPRQFDSYRRTVDTTFTKYGGSEAFQHLDQDPVWRRIFAGYAFAIDYREERGHAYMLSDQRETERVHQFKQPGSCLQCHASIIPAYIEAGLKAGAPPGRNTARNRFRRVSNSSAPCRTARPRSTPIIRCPASIAMTPIR